MQTRERDMYCSNCGEENMDNLESCIYCGSKLKNEKELQKIKLKQKIKFKYKKR